MALISLFVHHEGTHFCWTKKTKHMKILAFLSFTIFSQPSNSYLTKPNKDNNCLQHPRFVLTIHYKQTALSRMLMKFLLCLILNLQMHSGNIHIHLKHDKTDCIYFKIFLHSCTLSAIIVCVCAHACTGACMWVRRSGRKEK